MAGVNYFTLRGLFGIGGVTPSVNTQCFIVNALLTRALLELNVVSAGGTPAQPQVDFALETFNELLDNWNAERIKVYADQFPTFTITPNLQPHTIGPSGVWEITPRPVSIEGMMLILSTSAPYASLPITMHGPGWWQNLSVPDIAVSTPLGAYYNPAMENGEVYLWPKPTTAYDVQVWCRQAFSQVTQFQRICLPPGYRNALMMTLAEMMAGPMRKPWTAIQQAAAAQARNRISDNNVVSQPLTVWDPGMTARSNRRSDFLWRSGTFTGRG